MSLFLKSPMPALQRFARPVAALAMMIVGKPVGVGPHACLSLKPKDR